MAKIRYFHHDYPYSVFRALDLLLKGEFSYLYVAVINRFCICTVILVVFLTIYLVVLAYKGCGTFYYVMVLWLRGREQLGFWRLMITCALYFGFFVPSYIILIRNILFTLLCI
jgi:hypothetical protein